MIRHDHPVGSICKDVSPSRDIVPVYGQSPFDEEQQQTNILDFQTADVKLDGITYPNEKAVLSTAADKDVFKLSVTIAPTKDGKLTLMIPKNLTDSKVAGGKDRESVVGINANKTTSILGNINGEIFGK